MMKLIIDMTDTVMILLRVAKNCEINKEVLSDGFKGTTGYVSSRKGGVTSMGLFVGDGVDRNVVSLADEILPLL